jgi:hypothetical protein
MQKKKNYLWSHFITENYLDYVDVYVSKPV